MKNLILLPALFVLTALFLGCQSSLIEGTERAAFDGKEFSIITSR